MRPSSLFLAFSALSASSLVSAAPAPLFPVVKQLEKRDVPAKPEFNITYESEYKEGLPRTLIFATGGTIAGSSASNTDSTHYSAGSIGVAALVEAVPELLNVSNIAGMQVANVGSPSITDDIVLTISKLANQALCGENPEYDAVVVTHGTDTLEETAFTLDATLMCDAPVVVVGAMRPATAISADGPNNLLSAVTTAVSPNTKGRGVLIVLNDRICQAYYCAKREQNTLDTFQAPEQGFVGTLLSIKPFYFYPATQPEFKHVFDVRNVTSFPRVDVLIAYQGVSWDTMNQSIANGAKGFVTAGAGAGGYSDVADDNVEAAIAEGAIVVSSSKINNGVTPPSEGSSTIAAGLLNPILLALGKSKEEIREVFEGKLNSYLSLDIKEYY
ncbi:hypothetical protein JCM10213_008500 [Rhodosporidiobolus nylandii]